jgi:hypothetical protein
MSMVTPVGIGTEAAWAALVAGRSGAAPVTVFDAAAFDARIACEVKDWDATRYLPSKRVKELDQRARRGRRVRARRGPSRCPREQRAPRAVQFVRFRRDQRDADRFALGLSADLHASARSR